MASVVFMRGVNVGGRKAFRPAALAKDLSDLDVVNLGAAGTFVVRGNISRTVLAAEFRKRLSFAPELMICRGREILDLVRLEPFPKKGAPGSRRHLTVLAKKPKAIPELPVSRPEGASWLVQLVGVEGRFVLSLHRRPGKVLLYPNEVVEKTLGVPATTRNWDTVLKIRDVLEG